MSDLLVKRWARYGHDRLYVETPDGTRLGYWDNKAGAAVLEPGTDPAEFEAALAAHRAPARTPDVAPEAPQVRPAVPEALAVPEQREPLPTHFPAAEAEPLPPPAAAAQTAAPGPAPEGSYEPQTVAWTDLAGQRAGAAAREQAQALRREAPVRTLFARVLGVKTDERAWRIGADGEEAVAARLAKLGDRWRVLHAVPVGDRGSDIDHVVIGPAGVFTVNAKHHPDASVWARGDTIKVNGRNVPYVRNSRHEAARAARLLAQAGAGTVPVTGLVAFVGVRGGFTVKEQPADGAVAVIARKEIARWLAARPEVLTDEQVNAIHDVARRSSTWQPAG